MRYFGKALLLSVAVNLGELNRAGILDPTDKEGSLSLLQKKTDFSLTWFGQPSDVAMSDDKPAARFGRSGMVPAAPREDDANSLSVKHNAVDPTNVRSCKSARRYCQGQEEC